jgi:DNA-directed RNA polymerase specialized sigma24 family protein
VLSQLDGFGRRVLELRLQGLQLSEIAADTGRAERSVRRTLARIRDLLATHPQTRGREVLQLPYRTAAHRLVPR